jgi:hypothetical protein
MTDEQPTRWVHGSDEDIISTIAHALRYEGRKTTRQAEQLVARLAAERIHGDAETRLCHHTKAAASAGAIGSASEDGRRSVKASMVEALIDAADDLLAAQQQFMPKPLSDEMRTLTETYLEVRAVALSARRAPTRRRAGNAENATGLGRY